VNVELDVDVDVVPAAGSKPRATPNDEAGAGQALPRRSFRFVIVAQTLDVQTLQCFPTTIPTITPCTPCDGPSQHHATQRLMCATIRLRLRLRLRRRRRRQN
jgi:hypothetical protein